MLLNNKIAYGVILQRSVPNKLSFLKKKYPIDIKAIIYILLHSYFVYSIVHWIYFLKILHVYKTKDTI